MKEEMTEKSYGQFWNNRFSRFPFNNKGEVAIAGGEPKTKIKVNGQEKEVTQDELIKLAQMGDDYTAKTQTLAKKEQALKAEQERVAGLQTIVDKMEADPKLKETLNKVWSDYESGRIAKSENKVSNLKKIDKLIEEASNSDERERLRDVRDIIEEQARTKEFENRMAILEGKIASVIDTAQIGQSDRTEVQIEKLKEDYGDDLVNKHKDEIKSLALKYPRQAVENLLLHLADKSQIRSSLLEQAKKKDKEELEKKKFNSFPGGQDGHFTAKTPLQKDNVGRTTSASIMQRVLERLGKK